MWWAKNRKCNEKNSVLTSRSEAEASETQSNSNYQCLERERAFRAITHLIEINYRDSVQNKFGFYLTSTTFRNLMNSYLLFPRPRLQLGLRKAESTDNSKIF